MLLFLLVVDIVCIVCVNLLCVVCVNDEGDVWDVDVMCV